MKIINIFLTLAVIALFGSMAFLIAVVVDYEITNRNDDIAQLQHELKLAKGELAISYDSLDFYKDLHEDMNDEPIFDQWPMEVTEYQRYTSFYGHRLIPTLLYTGGNKFRFHKGLDIKGLPGAQIKPIAAGRVVSHHLPPGTYWGTWFEGDDILGAKIIIDHGNNWYSVSGHMDETFVREGQWVTPEDVIGRQGNTGMSTGPHLHFELWYGWENPVNPLRFIRIPRKSDMELEK